MATVLDFGLFGYFRPLFTFLLVWVIFYAVLQKSKVFGGNQGTDALVSMSASFLFMLTPGVSEIINIITPWFIVLIIFILLLVVIFMMVGVKESSIIEAFTSDWLIWLIVIFVIIFIFGFAFTKVFGSSIQSISGNGEDAKDTVFDVAKVLFHPRILGLLFILLVASQAIRLLGTTTK